MSARAKHFGRQFISENQIFTTEMLRPYEYVYKNEMHAGLLFHNRFEMSLIQGNLNNQLRSLCGG